MRHTSNTDLALTAAGEEQARAVVERLSRDAGSHSCSPRRCSGRGRTAELASFGDRAELETTCASATTAPTKG